MTFSFKVEKQGQLILLIEMKKTGGGARAVLRREREPGIRNMDAHTWGYLLMMYLKSWNQKI